MTYLDPLPAGPVACATIANVMIGHFATRLEVEARRAGGALDAEAIRALAERFMADEAARFQSALQRSWDACTQAREARQWESARRNPFGRTLTKPFAHLFAAPQGEDEGQSVLSRRLLPGFHLALNKMIGSALVEQCQSKCQGIVERHRQRGGTVHWAGVYADPEAHALASDVLMVVAQYFGNFERRREWFMAVVNSNLAAVPADAPDAHWQLTEHGFAELMRALFADLAARAVTDGAALRRRYGEQSVETLEAFFRRLDA